MKHAPSDWNDDQKLWEILGRLRPASPPSNFAWLVRQKLVESEKPRRETASAGPDAISVFRRRTWALATVTACLFLVAAILQFQMLEHRPFHANGKMTVETIQLAQNFELLQDIEVIEHLDELM